MPLITLTGYPTSGKTYRAAQLQAALTTRIHALPPTHAWSDLRIHVISDHSLGIPRSVYNLDDKDASERSNNAAEKNARATLFAAVQRVLGPSDLVILDAANYIKGWRYQLYCEAKAVETPHCVVHIGTSIERARAINEGRLLDAAGRTADEAGAYTLQCWENLVFRYEEPNVFVRWDHPLFTVIWEDEQLPVEAIWEALVGSEESGKRMVRPNAATVVRKANSEDYLHELDQLTQGILKILLQWIQDHPGEEGEVSVGDGLFVRLATRCVGLPALQRLKRQFISLNRANTVPINRIVESFVGYLNDQFEAM
ncbi:BgTH12-03033 [Blumeria graminis f. sp. triticale]|uniref:BgTH12-03033 n=3 Tax=Blumeria graminis TaxID=34373 RepID=A0A9W4D3U2_BLUGR|nr:BgTH12-03033 [Blumeria graminis f. sp. triticale]